MAVGPYQVRLMFLLFGLFGNTKQLKANIP